MEGRDVMKRAREEDRIEPVLWIIYPKIQEVLLDHVELRVLRGCTLKLGTDVAIERAHLETAPCEERRELAAARPHFQEARALRQARHQKIERIFERDLFRTHQRLIVHTHDVVPLQGVSDPDSAQM